MGRDLLLCSSSFLSSSSDRLLRFFFLLWCLSELWEWLRERRWLQGGEVGSVVVVVVVVTVIVRLIAKRSEPLRS